MGEFVATGDVMPWAADPRFRPGNLLLCARNASLLFLLDRETLDVVWHWRPGLRWPWISSRATM